MASMMTSRILLALGCLIAIAAIAGGPLQLTAPTVRPNGSSDAIAATVGTRSITLQEVEQAAALAFYQVDQQRHQLLQHTIQRMIDEELLAAEAKRKNRTVSQLLAEASQIDSIAKLANLPAPVRRVPAGDGSTGTSPGLSPDPEENMRIRQALLVWLRRQTDIRLSLPTPEPPILTVGVGNNPARGPAAAPVTIIEFSDFQCPYCKRSVSDLKELRNIYGERIRHVYRDYPGPTHPYAQAAAEAARCAGEQDKFWEYHDLLFERQSPGTGWDLVGLAQELRLQPDAFLQCLQTGRYRQEVLKDLQDGMALGVTSTPTFFINGRPLVGARARSEFQAMIDRLLTPKASS
jgi:protein-disulfide isomerase